MARFSFPFVQLAAAAGATAMVVTGQWLGAQEADILAPAASPGAAAGSTVILRPAAEAIAPMRRSSTAPPLERRSRDPEPSVAAASPAAPRPRLAVIIDDIGHDMEAARALMTAGFPVTLAILPYAEAAPQIAAEAAAAGVETFVHLPMEPVGLENPGPGTITTALPPGEVAARVESALLRVPGAVGLNNHMGSRATRDAGVVAALFGALAGRDLIFVDSLTHPDSIAAEAARAAGLAAFDRDVFLDSAGADPAAQLDAALARAVARGQAVAIGHPHPRTLAALATLAAKADEAGVELIRVSGLERPEDAPS